jgi:hypothetical protein
VTTLQLEAPVRARPSQAELHENRIARQAAANLSMIWDQIVTLHGDASPGVKRLNPDVEDRPIFSEFRFVGGEGGRWCIYATGASGNDLIDLVAHLGVVDRATAAAYLADVLNALN